MFLWRLRRYTSCSRDDKCGPLQSANGGMLHFNFFTFQSRWFTSSHTFPVSLANNSNFTAGCVWGFGHGWPGVGPRLYYPALHMQTVNTPMKYGLGCVFNQGILSISVACCEEAVSRRWVGTMSCKPSRPAMQLLWNSLAPYFLPSTSAAHTNTFIHQILCSIIKWHEI